MVTFSSPSPAAASILEAFELQSEKQWQLRKSTPAERIERLERLKAVFVSHESDIKAALRVDLGNDASKAGVEIFSVLHEIDAAVENLTEWMKPTMIEPSPMNASAKECKVIYEPKGVVLIFGPWNFPVTLVFQPLVSAVAAGNAVLVKSNEMAPAVDKLTAKIIREAFPPEEVAAFEGGLDVVMNLQELPVDHVFFTGSPAVGKLVMAAAAKHLASVTLELGGKNPVIVDGNTDIAAAAQNIAGMRNYNMGQVCLNPENIYVHEDKKDEFVEAASKMFKSFYKDGELNMEMMKGRIVNKRNLNRIKGYLDDAKAKGANIVCGGEVIEESLAVHPTILTDIPSDCTILSEETFAPILSIFAYKDIEEVYQTLQKNSKPLAVYIFSKNQVFVDDVLANTSSGGVSVNQCAAHVNEPSLPFGGAGSSGMGCYHGIYGFKELSHARAVLHIDVKAKGFLD